LGEPGGGGEGGCLRRVARQLASYCSTLTNRPTDLLGTPRQRRRLGRHRVPVVLRGTELDGRFPQRSELLARPQRLEPWESEPEDLRVHVVLVGEVFLRSGRVRDVQVRKFFQDWWVRLKRGGKDRHTACLFSV